LLTLFDFQFIHGDPGALADPKGLLLTREMAIKFFGRTDIIGETVLLNHEHDLHVTAVIENPPQNTHFNSSFIAESQASDTKMQDAQLKFLKETSERLEANLEISRQNLENMNVRAPVDGKLSGFNVEIGQSIGRGERLGQIDTPNDFKVSANIDEFYLDRVDIGQKLQYEHYQLSISKIYPQVQNGQFEVDFQFIAEQPTDIRRGQTVQTKLTLGDDSEAILIPNGTFYQDTGGKWIFVVSVDKSQAVKRTVKLGRRNSRYIEVLEGLEIGEQVITSPYSSYQDMEQLNLSN